MDVNLERCVVLLNNLIVSVIVIALTVLTVFVACLFLTLLGSIGSAYFTGIAANYFWVIFGISGFVAVGRSATLCVEYFTKNTKR